MNLIFFGILIFLIIYGFLWLMANAKSETFSNFFRFFTILGSILAIIFLFMVGRYLLSIPFFALMFGALKKRVFNIFNILYLFRLISSGKSSSSRFSNRSNANQTSMSKEEAYKILGLQPNCSKQDVIKAHKNLILHMHPDKKSGNNYLASKINEARDTLLKYYK
jgi:hypothetical protein